MTQAGAYLGSIKGGPVGLPFLPSHYPSSRPFPLPPLPLLFSPLSLLPLSPPLRSRPNIAARGLWERLSSPSGAAKRYLVQFRLKMLLVRAILSTYGAVHILYNKNFF